MFFYFFLKKCDIAPFCSAQLACISATLNVYMYSLPIKNKKKNMWKEFALVWGFVILGLTDELLML